MEPQLCIVSGTRNRGESCARFVRSVITSATVPTQLILLDASDRLTYTDELPRAENVDLLVIREHPPLGPNHGYNVGFRAADKRSRYVAYLNDDCECLSGWDRIALDFMDANPGVGCGAIYFRDPSGPWNFQTFRGMCFANMGVVRREAGDAVDWFETRKVFVSETGREESLSFYGNDVGIALKLIEAEWGVVPIPGCKVEHHREQDDERQRHMAEHVKHAHLPGAILRELWDSRRGFERLKKMHDAKFGHLVPRSETCQ